MENKKPKSIFKKILLAIIILGLLGAGWVWYIFNEKFSDTATTKEDFIVNALELIHEFEKNDSLANKKYSEKILVVNGMVSEVEGADSAVNVKMADTTSGSYIIFAFQEQHRAAAKDIKEGTLVSIKGSCSGGTRSELLGTEFITFKRCAINK